MRGLTGVTKLLSYALLACFSALQKNKDCLAQLVPSSCSAVSFAEAELLELWDRGESVMHSTDRREKESQDY